jgi:hypothetical protein
MVLPFSFSQKNSRCEFFCEKDLVTSARPEAIPPRQTLSSVDFFAGLHWNAVNGTGSGCRSNAVFSALGRAADAQKRVPTRKSLHLRARQTRDRLIHGSTGSFAGFVHFVVFVVQTPTA